MVVIVGNILAYHHRQTVLVSTEKCMHCILTHSRVELVFI